MTIHLLGWMGLRHAGQELPLARSHRRCVLAVLAMAPGRPIPAETLIDRVWCQGTTSHRATRSLR